MSKKLFRRNYHLVLLLVTVAFFISGCKSLDFSKGNNNSGINDKNVIKVALLQLEPFGADLYKNMQKGEEYCRKAKKMGADIVLFPEMWSIGYTRYHWPDTKYTPDKYKLSFEEWKARAIDPYHYFIKHFQDLARELELGIIVTYLEKWEGQPRNSASVIDADGNILMTYAKVHTSDMKVTESNCTPGEDFYVCDLPVRGDTIKLGIMICFDREFPESARILMLKGAELVLTPNACNLEKKRINQFQTRAVENAMAVAMANYSAPSQNGHSCAFDANGDRILVAGEKEGVFIVAFNMNKIRMHRSKTIWGNAYRRPNRYKLLQSNEVDSVFIRNNGLKERFDREAR